MAEEKLPSAPYVTFKTFSGVIEMLRSDSPAPDQIDKSLFKTYSGAVQSQLIATMKFLGLITDGPSGRVFLPTDDFKKLIQARGEQEQALFRTIVERSYPYFFDATINLPAATEQQIEGKLKETGLGGETIRKAFVFFVAIANRAGVTLSKYVNAPRRARGGASRRRQRQAPNGNPTIPEVSPASVTPPAGPMTNPQLAAALLGVLDEKTPPEVLGALWTVIKFLKGAKPDT